MIALVFGPDQPVEKELITISSGSWGFTAIVVSPSLAVSVLVRLGLVLLMTVSTIRILGNNGVMKPGTAWLEFKWNEGDWSKTFACSDAGRDSPGTSSRAYSVESFGQLRSACAEAITGSRTIPAPTSTVDLSLNHGDEIEIEERPPSEVTEFRGIPVAPEGVEAVNPGFDVTPAKYVSAIITEAGVARPPFIESLELAVRSAR